MHHTHPVPPLSVLEAANSDLASLINRLDLEATPDSKASRPVSFAITDPPASTRFILGESENPAPGGVDDSPLKKMTGSRASITSLRPYSFTKSGSRGKSSREVATLRGIGSASNISNIIVGHAVVPPIPPIPPLLGQPIMSRAKFMPSEDEGQAREPSKTTKAGVKSGFPMLRRQGRFDKDVDVGSPLVEEDSIQLQHRRLGETRARVDANANAPPAASAAAGAPRIRTSSSDLMARAAPFMRTPSVSSTFGSSLVFRNKSAHAHTSSPRDAVASSSRTSGTSRSGPTRYALPSLSTASTSPRSVITAGTDTPTPSPRVERGCEVKGHTKRGSSLVPFVKTVVQTIEAREAFEMEQQQRLEDKLKRRSRTSTSDGSTPRTATRKEGLDADARRELGFKGTMGVTDDDIAQPLNEEDSDSDIPDELQVILSQSGDTRTSNCPLDAVDDTLSFIPPKSVSSSKLPLPPSPGLPPAVPLPTPSTTPSVIYSPSLAPSPPAPTFLAFLDPSPSPEPTPDLAPPITTEVPTLTLRPVSEDGANEADIDEPYYCASPGSEDDTKQSFDFTGELKRLTESGGAHRHSFVEQLENAFKTPSRLSEEALRFELGGFSSAGIVGPHTKREEGARAGDDERNEEPNISMMVESLTESLNLLRPQTSVTSKPSYGRLDTAFKFGGKNRSKSDDSKVFHSLFIFIFLLPLMASLVGQQCSTGITWRCGAEY